MTPVKLGITPYFGTLGTSVHPWHSSILLLGASLLIFRRNISLEIVSRILCLSDHLVDHFADIKN